MLKHKFEEVEDFPGFFSNWLTIYLDENYDLLNDPKYKEQTNYEKVFGDIKEVLKEYSIKLPHESKAKENGQGGKIIIDINGIPQAKNTTNCYAASTILKLAIDSAIYSSEIVLGREIKRDKRRCWVVPNQPTPLIFVDAKKCDKNTLKVLNKGGCFGCSGVHLKVPTEMEDEFNSNICRL